MKPIEIDKKIELMSDEEKNDLRKNIKSLMMASKETYNEQLDNFLKITGFEENDEIDLSKLFQNQNLIYRYPLTKQYLANECSSSGERKNSISGVKRND